MKILHVVDGLHPQRGGVPTAVLNIRNILDDLQIHNDILSIGHNPDVLPHNVIEFPFKRFLNFGYSTPGLGWLEEHYRDYSAIYFHTIWNVAIMKMYLFLIKKDFPYFISPHGSLDPFDLKKKYYLKQVVGRLIIHKMLVNATYVFCTSQTETEIVQYFGKKVANGKVLPLPVNYDGGKNGSRERFRQKYAINDSTYVFLFLSRINYKKGLDVFIITLNSLISKGKLNKDNIKLMIAGDNDNDYSRRIQRLLEEENLADISIFTGLVTGNNKADAYVGSDLFILPSKNENFGLAIIESLQCGTPVLISKNVYIYKELFEVDGIKPGWLCNNELSDLETVVFEAVTEYDRDKLEKDALVAGKQYKTNELRTLYSKYF
jgi:glycosyltransferase involved in cell wall biosynthesis